ncbi:hypothetical protein [Litorilituus lipolyticus]|uniref:Transporter substrate-binding domain-containing protein n=1 Tax=Litorilituus lipolyticus TaxID=2491017 RepID=A0A502KTZ6_9GAMM|nr:hypothetical protein [Litorilituus lipolyticus]TPH15108.1 hypothetical protein EPA86_09830 [Litorilituus lipolyticus]
MRLLSVYFSVVFSYIFLVPNVFSQEVAEIVTEHFPPYQIQSSDGVEGVSIDIVKKLNRRLNIEKN